MTGQNICTKLAALTVFGMCALQASPALAKTWIRADAKDQVKGCSVTVYSDASFRGPKWTTTNGWAAVGWEFSDKISSIRVSSGVWQFFKGDNFGQQVETLFPGSYPKLTPTASNAINSFRCVKAT